MNVRPRSLALLSRGVVGSALSSVALFVVAAWFYPGGNHFAAHANGHDFWRNALCDVARSTTVGGAPNAVGAAFARTAMSIMAAGIGALFWLLPERFPSRVRLGMLVRLLGALTVPASITVVLLPADRFSYLHGVAIVGAGLPGLTAAFAATFGLVRDRPREGPVSLFAVGTVVIASVCFGIYVDELVSGGPPRLAVPVLERISSILLVAWMISAGTRPSVQHTCAPDCTELRAQSSIRQVR